MANYIYKASADALVRSTGFSEATREELKVFLALAATDSAPVSEETVAKMAGVSLARVRAAIALFEECGALSYAPCDTSVAEVVYEFEPRDTDAATAKETAKSIRDNDLYEMQAECESLLGKSLSSYEAAALTNLYTEKGLSTQYVLTLVAHVADTRRTASVASITRLADRLLKQDVNTLEELELYIIEKNREVTGEMEMRRLFGIRDRNTAPSERKYFTRWMQEFGYSTPIIGEAYDICVHYTGSLSYDYINATLEAWHNAGCKTLEECQAQAELHRAEAAKKAKGKKKSSTPEAATPKYADFNSEDALVRALERSYGADDKK